MASAYPSGLGNAQQASQATAAMRQEPWYNALLQSWGLQNDTVGVNGGNPLDAQGNPAKLSDQQRATLMATAVQKGIGFNNKYDMVDENGQIAEEHHKLKKVAIAAAIAGLAVTGLGAAGIGPLAGALSGAGAAAAGGGAAASAGGAAAAGGTGLTLGGTLGLAGTALSTGSKIAGLLGAGKDEVNNLGAQSASEANQLAVNRITGAKVDQGGPSADQTAFRNAMRAGIVSRMNPNAAPLVINGHVQPNLVTPENLSYAASLRDSLAARQAAGKAPTQFGVPDPTQAELDASGRAKTLGTTSGLIDTGSKVASLFGLGKKPAGGSVVTATDIPYDFSSVYGNAGEESLF